MEKNMAILMADLSGYTALTETHGPASAADLIDKYIQIAEHCLVGDSRLHERTGDEIMIVSESPDFLLATALRLEAGTMQEDHFLQVHGGLHVGPVLLRNRNYFGSTINLVSRIAASSAAGTFSCSKEFFDAVTDKSVCRFTSTGVHSFKNISEDREIFEIGTATRRIRHIDPVCRMLVQSPRFALRPAEAEETFFCSAHCLDIYRYGRTV